MLHLDYAKPTSRLAQELLGHRLEFAGRKPSGGIIVETEAYLGRADLACHSSKGMTRRTSVLFGPAGHAYVYLVYGLHCLFNVVTGSGEAVLIRAVALDECPNQRSGPGRLTVALGINLLHNSLPLDGNPIALARGEPVSARHIASGPRIGIAYSGRYWSRRRLRYWISKHPAVSR